MTDPADVEFASELVSVLRQHHTTPDEITFRGGNVKMTWNMEGGDE